MYHVPGVGYYFGNVSLSGLGYLEMGKFAGNEPDKWISNRLESALRHLQDAYNKIAGDPTLSSSKIQAMTTKNAELKKWLMDVRETIVNPTNVNWKSPKYLSDKSYAQKVAEENDVALPYGPHAELYKAAGLPVPGEKAKKNGKKEPSRKPTPAEIVIYKELGLTVTGNETVDELNAALAVKGVLVGGKALVDVYTGKTGKTPPPGLPNEAREPYEPEGESFFKKIPLWVWPVGIGSIGLLAAFVMMGMRRSPVPITTTANPRWRHRRY